MQNYGKELILDIHNVRNTHLFNRTNLTIFIIKLCDLIDMVREDLHFWDYEGCEELLPTEPAHLKGTSVCQFIRTSNIVIHTLDEMERIYINVFSCKDFKPSVVYDFCESYFNGEVIHSQVIERI